MDYKSTSTKLAVYRREIAAIRQKMRAAQVGAEPEEVADYQFATLQGTARLSDLFGKKRDLILVHNMGTTCPNCTLWGDGLNGIYHHLADRAAVVVSSPDPPDVQQRFAKSRGWKFPMVSDRGTSFAEDMGYRSKSGEWLPGISVFRRDGKRILRVSDAGFEPGDDFCTLWHILDLLPEGVGDWTAKLSYA
jgi:predicted dithiol-disulfide oxidoreductase (DUF899 family)